MTMASADSTNGRNQTDSSASSGADAAGHPSSPIIILTGASRGLGLSILQILLSRYNARVTTLSRSSPAEFEEVVKKYGEDRVLAIQGDVGNMEVNKDVVKRTVNKWGGIDGLVLNAGSLEPLGVLIISQY